ncbi:nuclear pore glycoprotein p62 isoform X2 [Petromyzon marinus]|uniref:nuclear pore glycoprotein p62 isoform X2 n=1 Tax=Petromyzon marinus TaxID=7757 RepID=UPI003F7024B3
MANEGAGNQVTGAGGCRGAAVILYARILWRESGVGGAWIWRHRVVKARGENAIERGRYNSADSLQHSPRLPHPGRDNSADSLQHSPRLSHPGRSRSIMSFVSGGTGNATGFSFGAQPGGAGGGFSFGGAGAPTAAAPGAQMPATGSAFSFAPATAAAPAASSSGFSFGGAGAGTGANTGFSFGQSAMGAPSTAAAAPSVSAAAAPAAAPTAATGFQLGGAPAGMAAPGGFAFGASGAATPASSAPTASFGFSGGATGAFSFSTPTTTTTQGLMLGGGLTGASSLGGPGAGASAAKLPFSFGAATSTGLTLGGVSAPTSTMAQSTGQATAVSFGQKPLGGAQGTGMGLSGGLSLGGTPLTSAAAGFAQGAPQLATAAPSAGFSLGLGLAKTETTTAPTSLGGTTRGFSLAGAAAAVVAPSATSAASTATSSSSFGFGTAPASCTTAQQVAGAAGAGLASFAGFKPPAAATATSAAAIVSAAPAASSASVAPVSTTATSAAPSLSFGQLEELLNKWGSELEEQEKHFLHQATQVNAWDRTLIENGDMITSLHKDVEKVKLDQKRLDQELDFILSQQRELEDLLVPLEDSVKEQTGTIYMQHADEERQHTYKLAENIDAQLKRMAQDLKEIIEHINTSSSSHNSTDPLQQICKILNAHMDSLQWIDQNTVFLQKKVDEVAKQFETQRKEQEHPYRLGLN